MNLVGTGDYEHVECICFDLDSEMEEAIQRRAIYNPCEPAVRLWHLHQIEGAADAEVGPQVADFAQNAILADAKNNLLNI